jgi:hypothetical protein
MPLGFLPDHDWKRPGSLHSYPYADSFSLQVPIESFGFPTLVVQSLFIIFTGLLNQKCYLLKARVIICAY